MITEIVRTSTGNDGLLELMNLSHITITTDLNFSTRKNHHGG